MTDEKEGASGLGPPASGEEPATPDEPILPATYDESSLREAVGASPRPADNSQESRNAIGGQGSDEHIADPFGDLDEPPATRRNRRTIVVAASSIFVGLTIAALVFLGRANAQRYLIVCASDHVSAEQGRSFPPWGSRAMSGPEWKPIALASNAECTPRETEDQAELERWYLDVLVDRATTALTARGLLDAIPATGDAAHPGGSPLDIAAAQLEQALLLARAPERRDQRKEVERLIGDVHYWRAAAHVRDATAALLDAAKQFDAAAAERPRHQSDAAAWATYLRKVTDDLHTGPSGAAPIAVPPSALPAAEHPAAPPGVAQPVEPAPPEPSATVAPPDAAMPSGGVLL